MTPTPPGPTGAKVGHCVLITTIPDRRRRRTRTKRTTTSVGCPLDILVSLPVSHISRILATTAPRQDTRIPTEDLCTRNSDQSEIITHGSRHCFISDRQEVIKTRKKERKRWRQVFSRNLQDPEVAQTHLPTTAPPSDRAIPETRPHRRVPPPHRFA